MSDVSQGPGWWQASDGKWYAPEQASGAQPAAPAQSGFGAPQPGFGAPQQGFGAPQQGAGAGQPGFSPRGEKLAEWPERAIAFLIDFLPLGIVVGILSSISFTLGMILWVVWIGWFLYIASLNGSTGQSIGKKITGLKVVSEETGEVIGAGAGILRGIFHFVDSLICYIGWLFPLWDAKKQTIGDKIAKTLVLTDQPKQPVDMNLFKS